MRVCPGLFLDQAQVEGNCFWESLMTEMGKLNSAHSPTVTALLCRPAHLALLPLAHAPPISLLWPTALQAGEPVVAPAAAGSRWGGRIGRGAAPGPRELRRRPVLGFLHRQIPPHRADPTPCSFLLGRALECALGSPGVGAECKQRTRRRGGRQRDLRLDAHPSALRPARGLQPGPQPGLGPQRRLGLGARR